MFRKSKYRHIYCDEPKPDACWSGFRLSTSAGDQQFIKASAKYCCVSLAGGGGPVGVFNLDSPQKFEVARCPMLSGHSGTVIDFDWNPFNDSMLATASEDTDIKLWGIPDGWGEQKGERTVLDESLVTLEEHRKKVMLLRFHPSASNVLGSASGDLTVKIWDVEKGCSLTSYDEYSDLVQDLVWDVKGDNFATSCKDKTVRLHDGRTSSVANTIPGAHEGIKSVKLCYLNESGKLLSVGTSRQASREVKVWDLANLSKPIATHKIDNGAGVMYPIFDPDTHVLYLCGKGDGNIRIYEFEDKGDCIFKLSDGFRSTVSTKGICSVPKRGLNVMKHENTRLMKVTSSGVSPLSFIVPRKSEAFQDDIFPDAAAPISAHTADEWMSGSSKSPVTMSLNPADRKKSMNGMKQKTFKAVTVKSLSGELDEAKKRIAYLESKLKEANIEFDEE